MKFIMSLPAVIALVLLVTGSVSAQDPAAREEAWKDELALRYGFAEWTGKHGVVMAGLAVEPNVLKGVTFVPDYNEWTSIEGERIVWRNYSTPDRGLELSVAVTRSCKSAQQLLLEHLSRPRAMKPLSAPDLPYGEVRLDAPGDVCFALATSSGFSSIAFVRRNVVVLFDTEADHAMRDRIYAMAKTMDRLVLDEPHYPSWEASGRWPAIQKLSLQTTSRLKTGSATPLLVAVTEPGNQPWTLAWEVTSGGIIEEKGETLLYAEGKGKQKLTSLMVNRKGLSAWSTLEFHLLP